MKRCRVDKVWAEMARLQSAISALHEVSVCSDGVRQIYGYDFPKETGAVRRASLDLTRALADLRKGDYDKLPGKQKVIL